ncbi:MAG: hypothetical protein AAGD96_13075 [Chloroflexota bacterium]
MKTKPILAAGILLMLAVIFLTVRGRSEVGNVIPAVTQTQFSSIPDDMHGQRYCEIVPTYRSGLNISVEVYVTSGHNECPADLWGAIDADAIADEYGAFSVKKNGPRYWVINEAHTHSTTGRGITVAFDGMEMRRAAAIETSFLDVIGRGDSYFESEVQRTTTFVYYAGTMVYELTSPDGEAYRMQSFSQIIDPMLSLDDLQNLGERLELPAGWQFEASVLTEESRLDANGLAIVIQDELENTYQKVNP